MKKQILTLVIGLMTVIAVHAQQTVVIQRPGVFTDLASAAGAIITLPLAVVEGAVGGTIEAAGSMFLGSTEVIVVPSTTPVPAPVVVATPHPVQPSTTITTRYADGSVVQVTRQTSAYELGPVVLTPVDPNHRVGTSPNANPYVYRPR